MSWFDEDLPVEEIEPGVWEINSYCTKPETTYFIVVEASYLPVNYTITLEEYTYEDGGKENQNFAMLLINYVILLLLMIY